MDTLYSVKLTDIIREFNLEILYAPDDYEKILIVADDVNRPGLQLAGFFDYFDSSRLQVLGKVENTFLERFMPENRRQVFDKLLSKRVPAIIISRGLDPFPECLEMAEKYRTPVLRSIDPTSYLISALISSLKEALAPRITRHGVLVEVYGEGILLIGESGVGKSESAIELVKRGHRLIADDAVELKKISASTLIGSAPDMIRHYIELRGIGIIDVRRLFGMGSVRQNQTVDLIINLEPWQEGTQYDRLGVESLYTTILDVKIPSLTVPVKPGRNLAIIIEVAAMNNREKKMGYNAAHEFTERINRHFEQSKLNIDH
jgi:HPr kinase/phosphorylase